MCTHDSTHSGFYDFVFFHLSAWNEAASTMVGRERQWAIDLICDIGWAFLPVELVLSIAVIVLTYWDLLPIVTFKIFGIISI